VLGAGVASLWLFGGIYLETSERLRKVFFKKKRKWKKIKEKKKNTIQ